MVSSSPRVFAELFKRHRAIGAGVFPLTNFTFFLGAGFSKSWESSYPTGTQLFEVPSSERDVYVERAANHSPLIRNLTFDDVRQIVYSLDMNEKYPDIRSRYVDAQNLPMMKSRLRAYFHERCRTLVGREWYWFDMNRNKFDMPKRLSDDQRKILRLFNLLFSSIDGSQGFMQGARFNFVTTNYDWIVEMIVDATCNEDDSTFLYLYRGITPVEICGTGDNIPAFGHDLVFNLLKLNGGFEILRWGNTYRLDYRKRTKLAVQQDPPILMLPSREQDYSDPYFAAVFPKAVRLLHESKALVLVGYSLPEDDALLRFIIRQFCEDEADAPTKSVFYVDTMSTKKQREKLRTVFPFAGKELRVETYSRGFASWAGEVVSLL